jgi:hypothetical protein
MAVTFNNRRPFAILNLVFSILLAMAGIGIVVAAGHLVNDRFFTSPGPLRKFTDNFFVAMIIAGLTSFIVAILGSAVIKVENRILPKCYGLFLILLLIIDVTLASVLWGNLLMSSDKGLTSFCDASVMQSSGLRDMFSGYVSDIDTVLVPMSSKWMCSKQCACENSNKAPWSGYTEPQLNGFARTKINSDLDNTDGTVKLEFINLTNVTTDPEVYIAFADCFYEWKSDWEKADSLVGVTPLGWEASAQSDFEAINSIFGSIDMIEVLATAYQCNGICTQGLFAFARSIVDGVPDKTCASEVSESFVRRGVFSYY